MGFVDGRNLEDRSVALIKMEVDVATLAQLNQEIADRQAAVLAEQNARIGADNTLTANLSSHIATGVSTAHPGQLNTEGQITNGTIGMHKLSFTPATQSDFLAHTGNGSIHFTIGPSGSQAAAGNHTHPSGPGSGLDADTVDGYHASAFASGTHAATHVGGGSDALSGTLYVNITGIAGAAYYSG